MSISKNPEVGETQHEQPAHRREPTALDHRYGAIGILAVAAVLPYAGARKNPAQGPEVVRIDQRFIELAV
jgi:hypothetical protein